MKLGILVVDQKYKQHLIGFSEAALAKGWSVKFFFSDAGVELLQDPDLEALAGKGVTMGYCETSANRRKIAMEKLPRCFKRGSQLQHAMMHQFSDKVLVL